MPLIYTAALRKTHEWLTIRGTLLNLQRRRRKMGREKKKGLRRPVEIPSEALWELLYCQWALDYLCDKEQDLNCIWTTKITKKKWIKSSNASLSFSFFFFFIFHNIFFSKNVCCLRSDLQCFCVTAGAPTLLTNKWRIRLHPALPIVWKPLQQEAHTKQQRGLWRQLYITHPPPVTNFSHLHLFSVCSLSHAL